MKATEIPNLMRPGRRLEDDASEHGSQDEEELVAVRRTVDQDDEQRTEVHTKIRHHLAQVRRWRLKRRRGALNKAAMDKSTAAEIRSPRNRNTAP